MRLRKSFWLSPLLVLSCVFLLTASIPNVPTGTWQTWNPMGDVRSGAVAVLLQDGRVLIIGGNNANGPVASADLFGTEGNFSAAAVMQTPRSGHTATVLSDGRVLVAGGTTSGGGITNSAEIYDPSADSWTLLSGTMVDARSGHTASLLPDGRVLLAGGQNSGGAINSLEIFDPSSGNFSGAGVMASAWMNHAAASLQDGRVLLLGGSDGTNPLASVDVFDPSAGTVSAGPNLSSPRVSASATATLDGKVAVIGGNNGASSGPADLATADILVADPSTGQLSSSLSASHLLTPRSGHQSFLLPKNNAILVIGGSSSGTNLNSAELYSPWADTFQATGSMSVPRPGFVGSATSQDGVFLAAGGTGLSSTELYGLATVKTDAADYPPGSTVTITGNGWQPGETVTLTLVESPLIDTHGPFTTVADAFGNISDSSFDTDLHDVNVKFSLTAVGAASNWQAQNTFTDASNNEANTLTLACAQTTISSGNTTTCTATEKDTAPPTNNGPPQGTVSWSISPADGTFSPTSCTLVTSGSSSKCTTTFTASSGGNATITGAYNRSGNNWANGTTGTLLVTVNQAPTITSLNNTTFKVGTAGTFTVTAGGFPASTFTESGPLPSGVTFNGNTGVLSGTPAANTIGTYPITFTASNGIGSDTTQNFTLTVNQAPTTTTVASSINPSVFGQSVTLTATVSVNPPGAGTPTGTVTFKDGSATITCNGGSQTVSSGQATCTTTSLSGGAHNTITAVYSGDGNFSTSTSANLSQTVSKAPTTTAVTSSVNPSLSGQSVTFTATISVTAPGSGTPTGTVQFKNGASNLGTAQNVSTTNGVTTATFSTSALAVGSHSITAVYSGDTNFGTSTSSALTQMIDALPVITSPSSTTFGEGMVGTFTVTSTGFPTPALTESGTLPGG